MAGPFKMKGFSGFGNSPMTKKSPAKTEGHGGAPDHTHPEVKTEVKTEVETEEPKGPPVGTLNDAGTKVIDEKGEWAGVGDRSDLVTPNQLKAHKEKMSKIKVPKVI